MKEWFIAAARRDIVARGIRVSVFVGTILVAINQGDALVNGTFGATAAWKSLLTYIVPYCVSTYAGVEAIRAQQEREEGQ